LHKATVEIESERWKFDGSFSGKGQARE